MSDNRVIGIDPGPVPGLVLLDYCWTTDRSNWWLDDAQVLQCSYNVMPELFKSLLLDGSYTPTLVQTEAFVVGRRASRSSTAAAGAQTRNLIGRISEIVLGTDARMLQRSAVQVKPWATDQRLQACVLTSADRTLWQLTAGMQHARDAARHALFAAVHDGCAPDPLSRKAALR